MAAARLGHAEVVRLLLAAGANVNARSIIASDDVLHNALCSDNPEVIRMILAAPGLNTNGRNPMELGIARGDAAAVQACIDSVQMSIPPGERLLSAGNGCALGPC